ncbi:YbaN family protein [Herminiimonas fonticola]|uniref:Inner membrane protein n=1 Tax=Herminiimonas fonticola TaxID=303380 RepID=A0A4R6GHL5_9BURK|nr:YbaN family protein [Herminiimonas fonticola]RBA24736.1 hypothetical protein Hfont_0369 [Herminiimonas fonticola]TDN93850.1 hypothetical protein EV677_0385 [Herminiimonas fonticola]
MTTQHPVPVIQSKPLSRLTRMLYGFAGGVALVLGVIGIFLPGLPTTPFVLVAAACFAKASPRVHQWMLQHPLLGPMLRNWQEHRSLTRRTKYVAIISMVLMLGVSIWTFSDRPWIQVILLVLGAIGAAMVLRIPTRPPHSKPPHN